VAGTGGAAFGLALVGFLEGRRLYAQYEQLCAAARSTTDGATGQLGPRISFSRQGSGPPVLLLHAAGLSRRVWDPVVDILAERYDLLVPDLPGFGFSPPLRATPDVANLTDAVASWLRDIGVERPHVVGNSLGGAIALELGFRGAARSVLALSPIGFWNALEEAYGHLSVAATYLFAHWLPVVATVVTNSGHRPWLLGFSFDQPDDLPVDQLGCVLEDMQRSQAFLPTVNACGSYRVREHQSDIPIMIAWGANDRVLIGLQDQRARRILPGAIHMLLPRCGHVCMTDDPDLVAATIDKAVLAASARG
jgi:pimeloyl-ACP methyl ester carboxylesterase